MTDSRHDELIEEVVAKFRATGEMELHEMHVMVDAVDRLTRLTRQQTVALDGWDLKYEAMEAKVTKWKRRARRATQLFRQAQDCVNLVGPAFDRVNRRLDSLGAVAGYAATQKPAVHWNVDDQIWWDYRGQRMTATILPPDYDDPDTVLRIQDHTSGAVMHLAKAMAHKVELE